MLNFLRPHSGFAYISGQQAVTASAVVITLTGVGEVIIKADSDNALPIYIGPSTVTTSTGLKLAPGDSVVLEVNNSPVYVIAASTGNNLSWFGKVL